jgi:hypothetical protein
MVSSTQKPRIAAADPSNEPAASKQRQFSQVQHKIAALNIQFPSHRIFFSQTWHIFPSLHFQKWRIIELCEREE